MIIAFLFIFSAYSEMNIPFHLYLNKTVHVKKLKTNTLLSKCFLISVSCIFNVCLVSSVWYLLFSVQWSWSWSLLNSIFNWVTNCPGGANPFCQSIIYLLMTLWHILSDVLVIAVWPTGSTIWLWWIDWILNAAAYHSHSTYSKFMNGMLYFGAY